MLVVAVVEVKPVQLDVVELVVVELVMQDVPVEQQEPTTLVVVEVVVDLDLPQDKLEVAEL